ncbi:sensor histidine kinase [Nocardioides mesophilus]|uniref:histidine kinase n=1 Tax=Nocardioides mesophilus TaxID=433659 RepID=A0A7G9REU8_9ACTN|nr:HAMP domain-containing sensor histidine kinase [Nocardioides mesophilus]QNN54123.1 HAMP domain-containing histidine kinase [Nocardioides mesophilus]
MSADDAPPSAVASTEPATPRAPQEPEGTASPTGAWRGRTSLRRQVVLASGAVTAAAMLLLLTAVQLVIGRVIDDNIDQVLQNRVTSTRTLVLSSAQRPGALRRLGGDVAVFDERGTLVGGALPTGVAAAVEGLATTRVPRTTEVEETTRLLAVPIEAGRFHGVVVAAEPLAPYERGEHYAILAGIVLAVITTAGVAALTAWTVRRTLAPVATMAATADDWSAHDLGRRFDLGPPANEISALGATLDHLLDRVAGALRAEQRLTAEVAHELRTPLTSIIGSADVALLHPGLDPVSREALAEIGASARRMSATVTTLVDLARSGADGFAESCSVGLLLGSFDAEDLETVTTPADLRAEVALPCALAVRALAPVLDNARRHRRTTIRVTAEVTAAHVDLVVDDDGAGLDGQDPEQVFDPGVRSTASAGAGLGLPLARRIARAAGGDVFARPREGGGRFVVRLPRR